jgi:hypothetical protein
VSYRFIDELQMKAVPVAQTCRLLGVSRTGFYEAKGRAAKPSFCKASVHLRAAFMSSGQSYGSRRLVTALANSGLHVGRYKVRRLMQQASLKPLWKRKFVHTTDSKHALPIAPNVLARQFNPAAPNLAYASDITYIRTGAGWLYLAVVLDLFSRRVVGWVNGAEHAGHPGVRCLAHGNPSTPPSCRTDCSLRPRQPICERPVPSAARRTWIRLQHEPQRQLLG